MKPLRSFLAHLSLIGESVGADDAFVVLNGGLGIAWLVLVPEVHVVQAEPLGVAFVPLKLIQQGPGCVATHVHPVSDGCKNTSRKTTMPEGTMFLRISTYTECSGFLVFACL